MNVKTLTIALLAGSLCMGAHAQFAPFAAPAGEANIFDATSSGTEGGYLTFSAWGVPDLQALTSDNITFQLLPNINGYSDQPVYAGTGPTANNWRNNGGLGPDGGCWLEMTTLFRANPIDGSTMTSATFNFTVSTNNLDPRYEVVAFVRVRNTSGDWLVKKEDTVTLSTLGAQSLSISLNSTDNNLVCDAGFTMIGVNANPTSDWGSVTVTIDELSIGVEDIIPPTPNPMTFATAPYASSDQSISMTATTATDDQGDVEYNFINTAGPGNDSGWQTSETYVDTGLAADTAYSYTVTARDLPNENEGSPSLAASASTLDTDTTAPTPSPMTFSSTDVSPITIMLTATTAMDDSEVEYYFANTAGGGNDSGWQTSTIYYDTGLVPGSNYSYTVIARDISAAANSTAASAPVNVTTLDAVSYEYNFSLTSSTGNTDDQAVRFDLEKAGLTTGSINADAIIAFDASGATFGDGLGYPGRDLLKTIATGYQNVSFEAYATLTFAGQSDLSGFLGMGQGLQTGVPDNYSVPELNLAGVNGVVAQFKDTTAGDIPNSQLFKFVSGNPGDNGGTNLVSAPIGSTETIRARLIYDAVAETVNVAYDRNYTGGAFVGDIDMGMVSTSLTDTNAVDYSMWDGAPVSIYAGGGEGTIVKDFEIVVTGVPLTTFDLQVAGGAGGGGVVLSWEGAIGQTYVAQYTTSLVVPNYIDDPTLGDIVDLGGPMSVTSGLPSTGVEDAFYRFILK